MSTLFWDRVNVLIKKHNITQGYLSQMCDIKYQTLRNWVSRNIFPQAPESVKIAQALGVTVEYLVTGADPAKPDTSAVIQQAEKLLDGLKKL
jgi:transcriptional regulator with XRE-family HTH domain